MGKSFQSIIQEAKAKRGTTRSSTNKPGPGDKVSEEEMIATAQRRILTDLDLPRRFKDKDFHNYELNQLQNPDPEKIVGQIRAYGRNFMEIRQHNNWMLLTGGYGLGKTHLAVAAMKEAARQYAAHQARRNMNGWFGYSPHMGRGFVFKTSSDLIQEIRDSYDSSQLSERETMERYKNCRLLLLDDLGTERASEWQQEKLHLILNHRYNQMIPTIITTNLDSSELKEQISPRLVDRIIEAADNGRYLWRLRGKSYRQKAV